MKQQSYSPGFLAHLPSSSAGQPGLCEVSEGASGKVGRLRCGTGGLLQVRCRSRLYLRPLAQAFECRKMQLRAQRAVHRRQSHKLVTGITAGLSCTGRRSRAPRANLVQIWRGGVHDWLHIWRRSLCGLLPVWLQRLRCLLLEGMCGHSSHSTLQASPGQQAAPHMKEPLPDVVRFAGHVTSCAMQASGSDVDPCRSRLLIAILACCATAVMPAAVAALPTIWNMGCSKGLPPDATATTMERPRPPPIVIAMLRRADLLPSRFTCTTCRSAPQSENSHSVDLATQP